jgi:hypothetical protein
MPAFAIERIAVGRHHLLLRRLRLVEQIRVRWLPHSNLAHIAGNRGHPMNRAFFALASAASLLALAHCSSKETPSTGTGGASSSQSGATTTGGGSPDDGGKDGPSDALRMPMRARARARSQNGRR